MNINGVSADQSQVEVLLNSGNTEVKQEEKKETKESQDAYESAKQTAKPAGYNSIKVDMDKINEINATHKSNLAAFQKMVQASVDKQGSNAKLGDFDLSSTQGILNLKSAIETGQFTVDSELSSAASEAIGENGYWGVEAVSDRLVSFAKAISGGDLNQYDKLVSSIEKGFSAAYGAWGGKDKMPEITRQTYDATMEKMAAWKNESSAVDAAEGASKS